MSSSTTISAIALISSSLIKRTTVTNLNTLFLRSKTPNSISLNAKPNSLLHPIIFSLSSSNYIPEYPGKGPPEFPSVPTTEPPSFPKEDPVVPNREPEIDPVVPPEIGINYPPQFNPFPDQNPSPKPDGPVPPLTPPGQDTPMPNPDVVPPRPPDVDPPRPPGPEIVPPPPNPPPVPPPLGPTFEGILEPKKQLLKGFCKRGEEEVDDDRAFDFLDLHEHHFGSFKSLEENSLENGTESDGRETSGATSEFAEITVQVES